MPISAATRAASSGNQRGAVARLGNLQFVEQAAETAAVLGEVDRFGCCTDDWYTVAFQFLRKIERRLSAELDDDTLRLFAVDDGQHIFERERFEIEAVGGVVVRRNRFRITIHHDGFETVFAKRVGGVATAVIEFNSLPDTIRAAAENHNFWALLHVGFVFVFVSGIHVRRERFKFSGAGIHAFENGSDAVARALETHRSGRTFPDLRELFVTRAVTFHFAQEIFRCGLDGYRGGAAIHRYDLFDLMNEPRIDFGELANLFGGQTFIDGGEEPMNAVGARRCEFFAQ
jgi:hypothetical protein